GFDRDDPFAIEMVDARRADGRAHLRYLAQRNRARPVLPAADDQRQRLEIGNEAAGFGRQADRDVPGFTGRIDPVTDIDPGKRGPQRLGNLTDGHAKRTGKSPVDLDIQFRLLTFGGQPHVDGTRTSASTSDWERERDAFGTRRTNTFPESTDESRPPIVV